MDEDFLKIGDEIILYSDTSFGYVACQGFTSKEIWLQQCSKLHDSNVFNLRCMAFRVLPRLSYAAIRELRRELKQSNSSQTQNPANREKKMTEDQKKRENERMVLYAQKIENLKKRVIVNKKNNLKFYKDLFGRKITYGTAIQLQHVDSGYFLQHSKRSSFENKGCSALELAEEPSPQRVTFFIHSRYKYRQLGDEIVFGDHILLYNVKYNQYLHVSEDNRYDVIKRKDLVSEYRPPSPIRRSNIETCFRRYEANMSQMYYKWQVLNFRQVKKKDSEHFLFSGDVVLLKHAETGGFMCHNQESEKHEGNPCYVRIFKGLDDNDFYTSNNLFEINYLHYDYYETSQNMGNQLTWRDYKSGDFKQTVTFRHLNSGKLLTVKQELVPIKQKGSGKNNTKRGDHASSKRSGKNQEDFEIKYILVLGEGISTEEMNKRFAKILEIEQENKYNLDFKADEDPQILELQTGCDLSQVFEIENTIIEQQPYIKNATVVKIKNVKYKLFISTEIKRLDGSQDEEVEKKDKDEEEPSSPQHAGESSAVFSDLKTQDLGDEGPAEEVQINEEAVVEEEDGVEESATKFAQMMVDEGDSIIFNSIVMAPNSQMDDVFSIEKFNFKEVQKLFFIYSCVPTIKEFIYNIRVEQDKLNSPYMKLIEELLSKMCLNLVDTESKDAFLCEGQPYKINQKYYRELRIIDLLVDILIYAFEGDEAPFQIKNLTQKSPIVRICQLCYRILKFCAKDHELNKFYVAQWISHFFDQSMMTNENNNLMAEIAITELVTNNRQLLDKQINESTIRNIIQICSDNLKNKRFIDLLSELCSCNGIAIASNQDFVCDFLLEDDEFKHLLIKVEPTDDPGIHRAVFEDKEVLEANDGMPLKVNIDKMQIYFQQKKEIRLYNYFDSMLRLTSLMCLSRNYAGINEIQDLYSLDFCIDCFLNEDIAYSMRSNLAKMLLSVHIDKDPLEMINVPILTRVWSDVTQVKNITIPSSRVRIGAKLMKLKDFAVKYFEDLGGICRADQLEQNSFTMQVLNIIEKMVLLGFYQNDKELLKILEPLIALLDPSNDFYSAEEELSYNEWLEPNKKKSDDDYKRDKNIRNKQNENCVIIISIKKKIIDILHITMDLQNDIRLTKMLAEFSKSDKNLMNDASSGQIELKYLDNILNGEPDETEIQEVKPKTDTKVIEWMKLSFFNKDLDMKVKSTKKDLICILLDVILFQDTVLVNRAFTLLTRYFNQKVAIIKYASEVQLLQDQQEVAILHKVSGVLRVMRKDAENSEFWIGQTDDEKKLRSSRAFIDQLEMLTELCLYNPQRVIEVEQKKNDDDLLEEEEEKNDVFEFLNLTELFNEWDNEDQRVCSDEEMNDQPNQTLLRNLRAHEVAVIIIRQQGLEDAQDKNVYLRVLEKCYIFLIKFVRNNRENQQILVEHIDLFMEDIEIGVHAWELIAEIFNNSTLLLSFNVVPYIKKVIKLIDSLPKETAKKTTHLSFLAYFMKFNDQPCKELQTIINLEITSILRKNCLHLFVGDLGLKDLHLYVLEMKNAYSEFMTDDKFLPEIQIPPELSYTIEYMKTLAFTAEGKNAITETRCQDKLPVQDILDNMSLADFCFPLKSALVYFMDAVYFDIEKDVSDENIAKFFDFIQIISMDLERFIAIQLRQKAAQGQTKTTTKKSKTTVVESDQNQQDLDGIYVDINKNFMMLTSFGSFPILYLIEKYIFDVVFLALQHYFELRMPIQPSHYDFYRKFLVQLLKASTFSLKEQHKFRCRELFKAIKSIPQLKDLGGDSMHNKNIQAVEKKNNNIGGPGVPALSQAQKLKAYMISLSSCDQLQNQFQMEFEDLVYYMIGIEANTEQAFKGTLTIKIKEILGALVKISDITSDIDKNLRIVCLKVIRKVIELENKAFQTPAAEWEPEDYINYKTEIRGQQLMLLSLGVVKLLCNLMSYESKLTIKEETLLVCVAMLLGGNQESQNAFNDYILQDTQNRFMIGMKEMITESFQKISSSQIKRNNYQHRLIQLENIIEEIQNLKKASGKLNKQSADELKKSLADQKMIQEDILSTDYIRDENPATYQTNDLTVARAIHDVNLCMKVHQLFCENHNPLLQNTLRVQTNEEGKAKVHSIDFPTFYAKIFEEFQKILNNNSLDVAHQIVDVLTESIQGPCKGNQKVMVNAKIFDSAREFIAGFGSGSEVNHLGFIEVEDLQQLDEFKQKIVTMLTSLLEGEVDMDIMIRMSFSLDMQVMKERMLAVFRNFAQELLGEDDIDVKEIKLNRINSRLEKDSFDGNIGEAFQIYILMHSLADSIKEEEINLQKDRFSPDQWRAFEFIRQHTGRIEINVNNSLQRVYFPVKPVCSYMSVGVRKQLMNEVPRDSQNSKVSGLMDAVPDLIDEMYHNEELSRAVLQITPNRLMNLQSFSTLISMLINFLYLFFASRKQHRLELDIPEWVITAIEVLGGLQIITSIVLIFFYSINKKPLITNKAWREFVGQNQEQFQILPNNERLTIEEMSIEMTHVILMLKGPTANEFNLTSEQNFGNWFTKLEFNLLNMYFFIQDSIFQYYVGYFGISLLGFLSCDIYYSLHLLDIVNRVPTLQNVIKSVTSNIGQLSLTFMLMIVFVYIHTVFTFLYISDTMYDYSIGGFDHDYTGENKCMNVFQCFVVMMNDGLRPDGGPSEFAEPVDFISDAEHFGVKLFHDVSNILIIKVILFNVLFGIIIDTFAQLRNEKADNDYDMLNICFICGHPRLLFDKYSEGGMERHIAKDHNLWMYVFFLLHLTTKNSSDCNGIESYVVEKYKQKDHTWLPRQKALCLSKFLEESENGDEGNKEIDHEIIKALQERVRMLTNQVEDLLEQIDIQTAKEKELKKIQERAQN